MSPFNRYNEDVDMELEEGANRQRTPMAPFDMAMAPMPVRGTTTMVGMPMLACQDGMNVPCELLMQIGDDLLNPAERSRLATCNRRLNELLPTPLRIKVVSSKGDASLQPEFFVSRACEPNKFLFAYEQFYFGEQYYLWTFDYNRGNKVYLGRHTRHGHKADENGDLQYLYTLGLRPRSPNQTWEIVGGEPGDVVMWGEDIGLSVGGNNPKPRHPDSDQRGLLSCFAEPGTAAVSQGGRNLPSWCVLNDDWGEKEKLQLVPCNMYVPGEDVQERPVSVHAIPDVCDEGEYLLHSPWSRSEGEITCEGYHVTVDFQFWIEAGIMHFFASTLPFQLEVPILKTDQWDSTNACSPLSNLLEIKSARWGCVIYYMAVAADVSEGKALDMERFLRRVTDHRDHSVQFDEDELSVKIDVSNKDIRSDAPVVPRDPSALWKFILSW